MQNSNTFPDNYSTQKHGTMIHLTKEETGRLAELYIVECLLVCKACH
ncbi:MAG: hypothetical protein LBC02_00250 [Planctomycetaceae bacterium]|nr:hypothetical protein [Planctomycetaceae bacterium]